MCSYSRIVSAGAECSVISGSSALGALGSELLALQSTELSTLAYLYRNLKKATSIYICESLFRAGGVLFGRRGGQFAASPLVQAPPPNGLPKGRAGSCRFWGL